MTGNHADGGAMSVLLVHGAWHTAAVWHDLADQLEHRRIACAVSELHRGDLHADIDAASQAMATLPADQRVLAVGHSYGGTVITGLPAGRLGHLLYLCATMPDAGETTLGLMRSEPDTALMRAVRMTPPGSTTAIVDPAEAADAFCHQLSPEQQQRHTAALVPQEMGRGEQSPATIAWHSVPSTYVICTQDRALSPVLQQRLAQRATRHISWPSDHSPFSSRPDALLSLIASIAAPSSASE